MNVKVGDPIWFFDVNHRVYEKDPTTGRPTGGPIWRKHWVQKEIIDETRVSWVVGYPKSRFAEAKLAKKDFADGGCPRGWATSPEHIEGLEWVEEHAWKIGEAVRGLRNSDMLKRVAAIVGYVPSEKSR